MPRYKIQVDPKLSVQDAAFGARVVDERVLVPERLAQALAPYSLGNDASTVAGFLSSFPATVAGALGLNPGVAIESAGQLVGLLTKYGVDANQAEFTMPPLGAQHPGLLKR